MQRAQRRRRQVGRIGALVVTLSIATGCWLNREWSDCRVNSDCPEGHICWANRYGDEPIWVCIPPEYVTDLDVGDDDQSIDDGSLDSERADVTDDGAFDTDSPDDSVDEDEVFDDPDLDLRDDGDGSEIDTHLDDADLDEETGDRPDPPAGVSASDGTFSDHVTITWDASETATSYSVFRGTCPTEPVVDLRFRGSSGDGVPVHRQ